MSFLQQALFVITGLLFAGVCIALSDMVGQLFRRRRAEDTATARVRSAHQGYVELQGRLITPSGLPLQSPFSKQPCVWWRFTVRAWRDQKWQVIDQGQSRGPWALEDDTGRCQFDPEQAQLLPGRVPEPKFASVLQRRDGAMPGATVPAELKQAFDKLPKWLPAPPEQMLSPDYTEEWIPFGVEAHLHGEFQTRDGKHSLVVPGDGRPLKSHFGQEAELVQRSWLSVRALPWLLAAFAASASLFVVLFWAKG